MENNGTLKRPVARLSAVAVILSEVVCAFGACSAPSYRRGRTWEDDASNIDINISIRPKDFAPERLICLAGALRQKYPERNVVAFMFSSHDAALHYGPSAEQTASSMYFQSRLHGYYSYDKEKHEEYLLIMPDARSQEVNSPFTTRIDLPVAGTPACKLAIRGRCLLAFDHMYYPSVQGNAETSGRVTLTGTIRRDGTLFGLAVTDAKSNCSARTPVLVDAAMGNLGTWRFAPAKRQDSVRLTYEFEVAGPPSAGYENGMDLRLPDEVRIRAH